MRSPRIFAASALGLTCSLLTAAALAQQPAPSAPVPQVVIIPAEPAPAAPAPTIQVVPAAPVTPDQAPQVQVVPVTPVAPLPPPTVLLQPPYAPYPYPIYVITLPPPPEAPPSRPQPRAAPKNPKPPPPAPTGKHLHDGFYLRMGLGAGGVSAVMGKDTDAESQWSTGGVALELGMGGSLGDGFILGGRIMGASGTSVEWQTGDETTTLPGSLTLSSVQLFGDWYPSPDGGFHVQAGLGPSSLTYDPLAGKGSSDNAQQSSLEGFGGAIGVGWEGWVGDDWSIGGVLNLQFASFKGAFDAGSDTSTGPALVSSDQETLDVVAPMLLFTATYN